MNNKDNEINRQLIGSFLKLSIVGSFGSDVVGLFLKLAKIWTFGNGYAIIDCI